MGCDATVIIERRDELGWEPIGLISLPRNYELFGKMKSLGCSGYPSDIDQLTKDVLDKVEDWGEGYISYKDWLKLLKKYECEHLNTIKKKYYDDCRVVYRFDC